jgi:shikimate dehydrogenase
VVRAVDHVLRPRCAVLGSPIAHSLSPVLHRAAYAELGLDWEYDAREVTEEGLAAFLDGLDASWRGLSLTMPLKRAVVPLLDTLSERAAQAGAANTVVLAGGRRAGHNTDVPGVAAALRERYDGPVGSAVVLGGGATATSALLALADLGCAKVTLLVRDPARARETVTAAGRHPRPPQVEVALLGSGPVPADVLVSTIPARAQDGGVVALADAVQVVFEVLYDPWPTPLASYARDGHQPLVGGLDLLVHQAALQVELMTGVGHAPLAAMRAAGERELAARTG